MIDKFNWLINDLINKGVHCFINGVEYNVPCDEDYDFDIAKVLYEESEIERLMTRN